MVASQQERTERLPWDAFLQREVAKGDPVHHAHIDGFRRRDWPNIKRELARAPFNLVVADGLEPHWVAPGRAVFWQEQIVRERKSFKDDLGNVRYTMEDVPTGWQPTDGGLPANNASGIAYWLNKGLRLRPPGDGVTAETWETTVSPEALRAMDVVPEVIPNKYTCNRHGVDLRGFGTWKAYIQHCTYFIEQPEFDPPEESQLRAGLAKYYCAAHDKVFNNARLAFHHVREEIRKPGKRIHLSIEQMKVPDKEEN